MASLYSIQKASLFTVFCTLLLCVAGLGSSDEVDALLRWKSSLQSQNSSILLPSWTDVHLNTPNNNTSTHERMVSPCNWYGVSCNENGSIHRLNLSSTRLSGTLEHLSFSSFPNLEYFELSLNNFSGIIPSEISYLSKLVYIDFSSNQFSGIIPPGFGQIRNLVTFYLYNNQLNGPIPQAICQMRSLSKLALNDNLLYGSIPSCLGQLTNLTYIRLNNTNISGSIPYELGNLSNLEELYLHTNYLTGSIPTTFVNLKKLTDLVISDNQLNGSIPTEIGALTSLELLQLGNNNLSGLIPQSLGELRSLYLLSLFSNKLTGSIPKELGNLVSLSILELSNNRLNGSIPDSFIYLHNLVTLNLIDNQLSGSIPREIGNLKLVLLAISNNSFSGSLPYEICHGGKLEKLLVNSNNLTGQISMSLYNCSSLIRVRLDGNRLTGDVSESFGVYPFLSYINLNDNQFFGEISDNWSKCKNLTSIGMAGNQIGGNIPPSLGNLIKLQALDLSSNDLIGEIPRQFGKLTSLVNLVLKNNQLSGVVPPDLGSLAELSFFDLSMNKLNGRIPSSIGDCSKLFHLNLSNNVFTHEIRPELGKLVHLSFLDLSHNSLVREIPSALSSLTSLEKLDVSHNQLSGKIPISFKSMNPLLIIDLSYNQLEGPIPDSKLFINISIEALQGNKDLCGNVTGLKQCALGRHAPNRIHKLALVISLSLLGAFLLSSLMGIFGFYLRRSRRTSVPRLAEETYKHGEDFFLISTFDGRKTYLEILKATKEFNEAYCIGKGGYGSVYKVKLASGDIFAVKRLHSSSEMMNHNDFLNEIRALTRIRHRNIVKLYGYCWHAQNSFLVYEYLEGGSLANILSDETAPKLDWMKRVNIIKGVAYALSYMHHDCSPAIVHRDISSKNILLDSECGACVSDFGTSKILNQNSSNWSNVAGTFGYLAPELAYSKKVTEKCDVYSFGVLVLEVIKGEHPGDIITSLTSPLIKNFELKDLMDHRLPVPHPEIQKVLTPILYLAIKCINSVPEMRPTMYDVSQLITSLVDLQHV